MTSVKGIVDQELHAPLLMGLVLRGMAAVYAAEAWGGLRQSHARVVTCVPPEGINVTALAERVGMTKQGCGQFVASLAESGHLEVSPDPADRRVRLVRRTPAGEAFVAAVTARMLEIEQTWAEQVGAERYAAFRAVLAEIAPDVA